MIAAPPHSKGQLDQIRSRSHDSRRLKAQLRCGEIELLRLIEKTPAVLHKVLVSDLFRLAPRMGPHRTAKILNRAEVSWARRLGDLTDRQRQELIREACETSPMLARGMARTR